MAENIDLKLFPFQKEDVAMIEAMGGNVLIANEMGSGKTIEALAWVRIHDDALPCVCVCPSCVKYNWKEEAEKWLPPKTKIYVCEGGKPSKSEVRKMMNSDFIIINYDILKKWESHFEKRKIHTVIGDEAHYVKSNSAQRSKAFKRVCRDVEHLIGMTGTPVMSKPIDIYNITKLICPSAIPDWMTYVTKYCDGHHNGYGWQVNGASNTKDLHDRLANTCMIRRRKEDIMKDLPPKHHITVALDMSSYTKYYAAEAGFKDWLEGDGARNYVEGLAKVEYMKQAAWDGKKKNVLEWLENCLEDGRKTLVFGIHKKTLNDVAKHLEKKKIKYVRVDGSVSSKKRQEIKNKFQSDDEILIFLGNVQAAGVGLTLTAADRVVFLEYPWTPAEMDQAIDRVHRHGQTAKKIDIYCLVARNTIEKHILNVLSRKRKISDSIIDGKNITDKNVFDLLIDEMGG